MPESSEPIGWNSQEAASRSWLVFVQSREQQLFLVLTLVIGALVGATVVAFIVLTQHFGARIYPANHAPGGV